MAVRIEDERTVVTGVVLLTESGRTVISASGGDRGFMERIDGCPVASRKSDVNGGGGGVALFDEEIGFLEDSESARSFHLHDDTVFEGSERFFVEGSAGIEVADAHDDVVDQFSLLLVLSLFFDHESLIDPLSFDCDEPSGSIEIVRAAPLDASADAKETKTSATGRPFGSLHQSSPDTTSAVIRVHDQTADLGEPGRLDARRREDVDPPDDLSVSLGHQDLVTVLRAHELDPVGHFPMTGLIPQFHAESRHVGRIARAGRSDVHGFPRHTAFGVALFHVSDTIDENMSSTKDVFPTVSLVIPAYNEESLLPRLLETIGIARERYRRGPHSVQVIVADNGSSDSTAMVAESFGCEIARVEERRIATVRNGGARSAKGEILTFVDADMQVHPETFNEVECALATGGVVAGATGVRLERMSPGIAVTYALFMPFVWAMRMDTGVVFCRREDFVNIGGYDERRSFGEDVQLLFDLKKVGRERGQKLTRLRSVKAVASTRKFDSFGDWHYFTELFRLLPLMVRSPAATSEFAERFWYGDQRPPQKEPDPGGD